MNPSKARTRFLSAVFTEQPLPKFAEEREQELKTVFEHYKSVLPQDPVMPRLLRREYDHFLTWTEHRKKDSEKPGGKPITPQDLLQAYIGQCCEMSPNLVLLMQLCLVSPVTSAEAERVFSCMNRVHDDERARMSQQMADDLMMISLNGPQVDQFDFTRAVCTWYLAGNRREKLSSACVLAWKGSQTKAAAPA